MALIFASYPKENPKWCQEIICFTWKYIFPATLTQVVWKKFFWPQINESKFSLRIEYTLSCCFNCHEIIKTFVLQFLI